MDEETEAAMESLARKLLGDAVDRDLTPFQSAKRILEVGVQGNGLMFTEADDDWHPMIITVGPNSSVGDLTEVAGFDEMSRAIVSLVGQPGTLAASLLLNTWAKDPVTRERIYEQLIMFVVDHETTEVWTSRINRYEDRPPTLEPWNLETGFNEESPPCRALRLGMEISREAGVHG